MAAMASVTSIVIAAISVATVTRCRDTIDVHNPVAASDDTGNRTLELTAAALKLDLVKGHAVTTRTNPLGIPAVIEVNIAEADIMCFIPDRPATGTNRAASCLAVAIAPITVAIVAISTTIIVIPDRAIASIVDAQTDRTIAGLNRDTAREGWTALTMFGERGRCEEQRRRNS